MPIVGSYPNYTADAGSVNGLGIAPNAQLIVIGGVAGGVLYASPYGLVVSGQGGQHTVAITAYVSSNFAAPTAVGLYSCPVSGSCSAASGYSPLSLSSGTQTIVDAGNPGGTTIPSLAIWVRSQNGPSALTGSQSATITFLATESETGHTDTLRLTVSANGQGALQLTVAQAPSGLAAGTTGSDIVMDFGFLNALGIGTPVAGVSVVPSGSSSTYVTPYLLQPLFSNFTTTSSTLQVTLVSAFAHPGALTLQDAGTASGPYTAIPASPAITIATGVTSGTSVTRYLGVLVANVNGASAYTGPDHASLLYTMVVQ